MRRVVAGVAMRADPKNLQLQTIRHTNRTKTPEVSAQNPAAAPSLCYLPRNNSAVTRQDSAHIVIPPIAPALNFVGQCLKLLHVDVLR